MAELDTIIVGGGPAGLGAALVLARCRRRVLVIDAGRPRNYASLGVHNYPTRDGVLPSRLLSLAREEVRGSGGLFRRTVVARARRLRRGIEVTLTTGRRFRGRTILLATGVSDLLPSLDGIQTFYGRGVHHCPYCDALPYSGKPIAAFGKSRKGLGLAMNLRRWSRDVTVLTGGAPLGAALRRTATAMGLRVRTEPILRLEARTGQDRRGRPRYGPARPGRRDRLARVVFDRGDPLVVSALFFNTGQVQRSDLPQMLGCMIAENGGVQRDRRQRTGIPGVYLAGDASRDVQFAVVAAAEGAKAGVAINADLQREDWADGSI